MAERLNAARATPYIEPAALGIPASGFLDDFTGEGCDDAPQQLRFEIHDTDTDASQITRYLSRLSAAYAKNACLVGFVRCLLQGAVLPDDRLRAFEKIAGWVMSNLIFQADPRGMEYVVSPVQLLKQWYQNGAAYGDCDDHVVLLNSLLGAAGIPTKVLAVQLPDPQTGVVVAGRFNHVLSQVDYGKGFRDFDACNKADPFHKHPGERLVA